MQVFFPHATCAEMIKDLENIKGDLASGYRTIPILYRETYLKKSSQA
jgi:4-hydroxybenzoate polyprenyltransferase